MKWNLRLAAASRSIWKASELQKMLAEPGMVIRMPPDVSGPGHRGSCIGVASWRPVCLISTI